MAAWDLCSKNPVCIERTATVQFAAHVMKSQHVGGLVVLNGDPKKRPAGIVTDRDIALGVVAENRPLSTPVETIMSRDVVTVARETGIAEMIELMEREGVRRVVIVDEEGGVVGFISSDDVLQLLAREMNAMGRLVQRQLRNESAFEEAEQQLLT